MDMREKGLWLQRRLGVGVQVFLSLLALTIGVVTSLSAESFAATTNNAATNNAANTLKVSPVRTDIEIPAGSSKKVDTYIANLTDAPITVRPVSNDFIAGDERGTPALILDADKYAPTHSLKRFMGPLADTTIPPKQTKTITVTITVPKDAQPGGYFGAVRFAPTDPNGGGQINLSASVASLVLLTVPGAAVEKLDLTEFQIQQSGQSSDFFRTPDNLKAAFRFQNNGNIQLGPFGKLSILKGDKVVHAVDFNTDTPREMVLPDSARRWDIPLEKIETFGHYTVKATFTYGVKNQSVEVTKSFWVVPFAYIVGGIVGLLLLIGLIIGIIVFLRGYKRRILRKHGGGSLRIK